MTGKYWPGSDMPFMPSLWWSTKMTLSCSHFLTDKIPNCFSKLYPTNAGVTNKISSQLPILLSLIIYTSVSQPGVTYFCTRVHFSSSQGKYSPIFVLRGKINSQMGLQVGVMLIFTVFTITSELPINLSQLFLINTSCCYWRCEKLVCRGGKIN